MVQSSHTRTIAVAILAAVLLQSGTSPADAYLPSGRSTAATFGRHRGSWSSSTSSSSSSRPMSTISASTSTDFSSFADSLESDLDDDGRDNPARTSASSATASAEKPWQAKLDDLLDPSTNLADRQILVSELLTSNDKIRDDVLDALANRKIDPLLTPAQKKLQEGTRAVVRQLANDILPQISTQSASSSSRTPPLPFFPPVAPSDVQSIGTRLFSAVSNQIQKNLEDLQEDLTDPINKIPARLERQREEVLQEAKNVFLEKPEGLEEPSYTVVESTDLYEIRSYESYSVASTALSSSDDDSIVGLEGLAAGSAFNALASYIFGGNDQGKVMDMTTPVTTTSTGEMRFYLNFADAERIPTPASGSSSSNNNNNSGEASVDDSSNIEIVNVPAALLAIRKFPGFATDGEVARQKDTLLQALETDGVELDVAHGAVVPHVVFQYNPPYTLPMVRCNEIGVPVRSKVGMEPVVSQKEEWSVITEDEEDEMEVGDDDIAPSDVE
mmetsp:Transcript_2464/g.5740  ORF Transcript_2464/g.5740 Transcript_2464/m.5740 type:complete len:500 (-) Transcript_2464:103-1602(-)